MKILKITLFKKEWTSPVAWASNKNPEKIEGYIEYKMHFDFKQWLRFSISIPNYTYCTRNPFKCLFAALEYSDVGMGKYQRLKERTRKLDMWRKL
jgi:hypothetical protein